MQLLEKGRIRLERKSPFSLFLDKSTMFLTWSQISSHFFSLSYCRSNRALSGGRFIAFWKKGGKDTSHSTTDCSWITHSQTKQQYCGSCMTSFQFPASHYTETTPWRSHLNIKSVPWREKDSKVLCWDVKVVCFELQTRTCILSLLIAIPILLNRRSGIVGKVLPQFLFKALQPHQTQNRKHQEKTQWPEPVIDSINFFTRFDTHLWVKEQVAFLINFFYIRESLVRK